MAETRARIAELDPVWDRITGFHLLDCTAVLCAVPG